MKSDCQRLPIFLSIKFIKNLIRAAHSCVAVCDNLDDSGSFEMILTVQKPRRIYKRYSTK